MNVTNEMKQELASKLEKYLSGLSSHEEISEYAWELSEKNPEVHPGSEKVFWSAVFSIIHLADDEHWKDGCTQNDLGNLCAQLKQH